MGSNTKRRTTMAKLNRENRLREKRMEKDARKEQRKAQAANGEDPWAREDDDEFIGVERDVQGLLDD